MLRITTTLIFAALTYVAALVPAFAEKRVALVFGNSDYRNAAPLKNPRRDATSVAAALRRLGFRVIEGIDMDRAAMESRIRSFAKDISDADVALFYYAGHGLQVNGQNYLAPVTAKLEAEADLDFEAIPLNLVLRQMQRSARISLVFLDACRDNPLVKPLVKASRSMTVGRGLARVEKASGMLISFATEPGSVALDGDGRNSPFTTALLKHIETSEASVSDVMIDVRKDVMAATKGQQIPWENSSLTGKFYFKSRSLAAAGSSAGTSAGRASPKSGGSVIEVADSTIEHTFWISVQSSNDPQLYKAYLDRFPNGVYAPIARAKAQAFRSIAVEARPAAQKKTKGTKVAQLQPASSGVTSDAAPSVALDGRTLAMLLQTELKRVGCYTGAIDGLWGNGSRGAVTRFNSFAGTALDANAPQQASINLVSQQKVRVCATARPRPEAQIVVKRRQAAPRQRVVTQRRAVPQRQRSARRPIVRERRTADFDEAPVRRSSGFSFSFSRGGGGSGVSFGVGGIRF